MKVVLTKKEQLLNPRLEIHINLESGEKHINLTYTCAKCSGYGCHAGVCQQGVVTLTVAPEALVEMLGDEGRDLLENLFSHILHIKG